MKKILTVSVITIGLLTAFAGLSFADTPSFTPLNFDDSNAIKTPVTTTSKTVSGVEAKGSDLLDPAQVTGGAKMQNAILQLDNAQVEVRNQLLNYRANYAEIDARYNTIKAQRKTAKKQIKQAEKKIKNLDKAKNKIKKNFERRENI